MSNPEYHDVEHLQEASPHNIHQFKDYMRSYEKVWASISNVDTSAHNAGE